MGFSDDKFIGTILGDVYGITLGLNVGIDLGYLDESFDDFNDGKIEVLFLVYSMNSSGGKVLGNILGNVDEITFGVNVGTYLVSLDGYFDFFNDGNLGKFVLGNSLESTDCKLFGSDEGINMGSADVKVIGTILVNVDGITLGIDVVNELVS